MARIITLGSREVLPQPTMEESAVNPVPPDTENSEEEYQEVQEYLDPTGNVEMDNHERGTFLAGDITPAPLSLPSLLPSEHPNSNNPPESIMPAPQQNTAASAGTVALFRRNLDSPLFKIGNKRPAQEEEDHRKQMDEKRKNQKRIFVRAIQLCDDFVR